MKPCRQRLVVILFLVTVAIFAWIIWQIYRNRWRRDRPASIVTCTVIGKKGRLGNQLFQLAAVIGTARTNGCNYEMPNTVLDTDVWKFIDNKHIPVHTGGNKYVQVPEAKEGFFSPISIPDNGRIYDMDGFFQSYLYSETVLEEIRKLLRPRRELVQEAVVKVPLCTAPNAIGIHIRRGDYTSDYYSARYTSCTPGYYQRAVRMVREVHGNGPAIICSDDIAWCKQNLAIENSYYVDTGSSLLDFTVLYLCQHSIIANSSFSWWAAHLKPDVEEELLLSIGKEVVTKLSWQKNRTSKKRSIIAPHPWYISNGPLAHLNSDDIYYPNWTVIRADGAGSYLPKRILSLSNVADTRIDRSPIPGIRNSYDYRRVDELYGEVYVVSLRTEEKRWNSAREILQRVGLHPNRFIAIDKKYIAELGGRRGLQSLSYIATNDKDLDGDGTIGCGLSHMAIWSNSLCIGAAKVTIFEDDIASHISGAELDRRVQEAMKKMDLDWDFLFLGKCIDRCDKYEELASGLYRTYRPFCTHAYIISARGMRKMLSQPLLTGIDSQIVKGVEERRLKAYTLHPSVFVQDIVRWSSSLRSFEKQIGNQVDCAYMEW